MKRSETLGALAIYALLTLVLTWPLARGLTRDVPGDLGDPVLNAWIVSWDADHLARALTGDLAALGEYWHPPIFAPHPLALAYSEHLTPQALQVLPVYLVTRNPILGYNLLFLSTFVLSALGMFLFVRTLTGSRTAAFLAGLAFGFAPYRIAAIPHLQVLSSAWMPFTLFFLRRHFDTRRFAPLGWAALAWTAQNLSCGYYLLFFSPIVALYLAWELTVRRLWTDRRALLGVVGMVVVVVAATAPFLAPYWQLRQLGFDARSIAETLKFRADVYGFFTASEMLRLWGSIARAWPAPEGELFPGLTILLLAALAVADAWRRSRAGAPPAGRLARGGGWLLALVAVLSFALLLGWSIRIPSSRPIVKITDLWRVVMIGTATAAVLLARPGSARGIAKALPASPAGFFLLVTMFGAVMALGPDITARGRIVEETAPYAAFYRLVPGADGLRVPARFAMIVALGLAVLAGLGAAVLLRRARGQLLVGAAGVLIVVEAWAAPIPVNHNDVNYRHSGLAPLPPALAVGDSALPVYEAVAALPADSVLLEMPLGEPAFDVRYMLYGLAHGHALVNGFSGGSPTDYQRLSETLKDALTNPEQAWNVVADSAATHVLVHEAAYQADRGGRLSEWMSANGAREVARFGGDRLFSIR